MTRKLDAEGELARVLLLAGPPLDSFEVQYRYVPGRRFTADFAYPDHHLLVEIQGGVFTGQAHGSVKGVLADLERLNLATVNGWKVLRFLPSATDDDEIAETLDMIERALTVDAA